MGVAGARVTGSITAPRVGAAGIVARETLVSRIADMADFHFDYLNSRRFSDGLGVTPAAVGASIARLQDAKASRGYALQDNASWRPAVAAAGWDFDGSDDRLFAPKATRLTPTRRFTLPDLSDSIAGKGFTGTGITASADGALWVANDGRSNASDSSHRAGLVNVSTAGGLITEYDKSGAYASMTTIQGVVYDDTDDSIWFASTAENLIRHISAADGSNIGSFSSTSPNGLALDTSSGFLIVTSTTGVLTTYNKSGTQQATFQFEVCDCLYMDSAAGILYFAMEPAGGENYIGLFHLASRQHLGALIVADAAALEGMVVVGSKLYVTSDNYFHGQTGTNEVLVYDLPSVPALTTYDKFTLFFSGKSDGAVANARSIVGLSSGGVTNAGLGLFAISNSATGLRVFANTTVGTTQRSFVDFTSLPNLSTAYRAVVAEIDTTAEEVRLWVDGVQYGGTQSIPNVSGGIASGMLALAGAKFASDEFSGIMKCGGVFNRFLTTAERNVLDRYLATRV